MEGRLTQILAECCIMTGRIMERCLHGLPKPLKDDLVKQTFENILHEMTDESERMESEEQ